MFLPWDPDTWVLKPTESIGMCSFQVSLFPLLDSGKSTQGVPTGRENKS